MSPGVSPTLASEPARSIEQIAEDARLERKLRKKIETLIEDSARFFETALGETVVTGNARRMVILNATAFVVRHGRVTLMTGRKDITHGAFAERESYYDGGPGPRWETSKREFVNDTLYDFSKIDIEDRDEIAALFGAFIDFWAIGLDHIEVLCAVIFFARLLWTYDAILWDFESAKVSLGRGFERG